MSDTETCPTCWQPVQRELVARLFAALSSPETTPAPDAAIIADEIVAYYKLYDFHEVLKHSGARALVDWLITRGIILSSPETTPAPETGPERPRTDFDVLASLTNRDVEGQFEEATGRTLDEAAENHYRALAALSSPETTPAGVLDEAALREALRVAVGLAEQNRDAILAQPYDSRYRDGYRSGIDAAAAIISGSVARALAAALGRSGSGGGRG